MSRELKRVLSEFAEVGYKDYEKKAIAQGRKPISERAYFKIIKNKYDSGDAGFMRIFEIYKNRVKVVKENEKTVWVEAPDGNVVKKKKGIVFKG